MEIIIFILQMAAGAKTYNFFVELQANASNRRRHVITLTSDLYHMSVMRVIVLHPYMKSEVSRPSHSEDIADFWSRR